MRSLTAALEVAPLAVSSSDFWDSEKNASLCYFFLCSLDYPEFS